ncbi:MAG: FG-GAP-like repeat-containing protein, partial [Pyrinomonadaceae bacterium]
MIASKFSTKIISVFAGILICTAVLFIVPKGKASNMSQSTEFSSLSSTVKSQYYQTELPFGLERIWQYDSWLLVPPSISSIAPPTPQRSITDQLVRVNGSNFVSGLTVTVTFPSGGTGTLEGTQIQNRTSTSFIAVVTLNAVGTWCFRVNNPNGEVSNTFCFSVVTAQTPVISSISPSSPLASNSDQNIAVSGNNFQAGMTVTVFFPGGGSGTLSGSQLLNVTPISFTMVVTLNLSGTYGIRINNPSGLVSGTFNFMVRPSITSISPASPCVRSVDQSVTVNGAGFQSGLTVTVFFPGGGSGTLGGSQIQSVTPSSFTMIVTLNIQGTYGIRVNNPNGTQSPTFNFSTQFCVTITSITPPSPPVSNNNQNVNVNGSGFTAGLTVTVFFPGGGSTNLSGSQIQNLTSTSFTMVVTLNVLGQYGIRVNNPNGNQSNIFNFNTQAAGTFNISASPTSQTVVRGTNATFNVALASVNGFSGTVSLFAINLPNNQVLPGTGFNPSQINLSSGGTGNSTLTIVTNGQTPTGTFTITVRGTSGAITRDTQISLTISTSNPAPVITPPLSPSTVNYNQATTLMVNGSNFRPNFAAFVITPDGQFQIASAGLTYVNSNQVRVQVLMLGAPPYNATLKIVNDDGQFATGTFQVTGAGGSAPTITNIAPNSVTVNQTTMLTVTGANFVNEPLVKVSANGGTYDIDPSVVFFDSSTQIRVQVNMGSTPPYQATLKVINPDQQVATRGFNVVGVTPSLELFGLEITQALQDLANSMVLIQDKRTFVRAHVKSNSGITNHARAKLIGRRNGVELPESPLFSLNPVGSGIVTGSIQVKTSPSRTEINDSFLFELPSSWRSGTVDIEFQGISNSFSCREDNGTGGDCHVQKIFDQSPAADASLIGIIWRENGLERKPTSNDLDRAAHQIEALFPIPRLTRNYPYNLTWDSEQRPQTSEDFDSINLRLGLQKLMDGCMGPPSGTCNRYYIGVILTPSGNEIPSGTRGSAAGIPSDVTTGYLTPIYTVPHEFGHSTGRRHTDLCGARGPNLNHFPSDGTISYDKGPRGTYGFNIFDIRNSGIYSPYTPDFMGYCFPRWISIYNYHGILAAIRARYSYLRSLELKIADGSANLLVGDNEPAVVLSGTVELNQSNGLINSIYRVNSPTSVLAPAPGNYAIRFENISGQTVASYSFAPDIPSEGNRGSFNLLLPWNVAVARMSLLFNDQVISSRTASLNPPTVTITSPNGGEVLGGNSAMVSWNANDADGDPLKYVVQFSSDNGTTWKTIATDWLSTNYLLDLNSVVGTSQGRIRILASDGFHTAEDQSDAVFTVGTHRPSAAVVTPDNNSSFVGDQPVVLQGNAFDLEDGVLAGSALVWTSSLDGALGNGTSLSVHALTLTEGSHTITLSATDSGGQVGSAAVNVQVFRSRPVIPASLSTSPSAVNLTASIATLQSTSQVIAVRNNGDGTINWTASDNQSWLQIDAASGVAPANIVVTANPTGLALGIYHGQVTVSTPDAPNSPQIINVELRVVTSLGNTPFDFDGDGKTDVSISRVNGGNREWWYQRSSNGQVPAVQFGLGTDKIVPGDFTGDGKTDIAFWRP